MGQRRMFSLKIINSARFLKMPIDSQVLYFHLGMRADDDGIVEAYPIMKMLGNTEDNLKVLAAKCFIKILNEDLVSYITDWKEHNLIRADRKVDSIYKDLLLQIVPEAEILETKPRSDTVKGQYDLLSHMEVRNSTKYLPWNFRNKIIPKFIGSACPNCKKIMTFDGHTQASIQHNLPIAQGGEHRIENISIICFDCNMKFKNIITSNFNNKQVINEWNKMIGQSNDSPTTAQVKLSNNIIRNNNINAISTKKDSTIIPPTPQRGDRKEAAQQLEIIPDLLKDQKRHIQIIGMFAKFKRVDFKSKEEQGKFIKRYVREASLLDTYDLNRIAEVMMFLERTANFKWTIATVGKYIDDDLNKLFNQVGKIGTDIGTNLSINQ